MKVPHINFKLFVVWVALCALGGALLGCLSGMSFFGGALIVAVALVINGVVAEVEDHATGGFFNPRGKSK